MDLRISPMPQVSALNRISSSARGASSSGVQDSGFANTLKSALGSVSSSQKEAQVLQREVQLENPNVSIEETMIAMQKAQLGFQATLHVRNRMVQAYTDIMNMQV